MLFRSRAKGGEVTYSDPYVPHLKFDGLVFESQDIVSSCKAADCVVIVTDHKDFDYQAIETDSSLIVDTRNGMKNVKSTKVVRL